MALLWLPTARRAPLTGQPGFPWQVDCPTKGVLHTTEGGNNVPSYTPGLKAPHLTILVRPGAGVDPVQHIPFNLASYSLVHAPGTVATNGAHAIQIEMAGTCQQGGPGYYWPGADDAVLTDLYRKVLGPLGDAYGIKLKAPTWKGYPASYGSPRNLLRLGGDEPSPLASPVYPGERTEDDVNVPDGMLHLLGSQTALGAGNGVRFTEAEWLAWNGWNGHEHVPGGNVHGDPGAFPWARLAQLATGDDDMTTDDSVRAIVKAELAAALSGSLTNLVERVWAAHGSNTTAWQALLAAAAPTPTADQIATAVAAKFQALPAGTATVDDATIAKVATKVADEFATRLVR